MRLLEVFIQLVEKFEGCKLKAYLCPAGVWTIGFGATGRDIKIKPLSMNKSDVSDTLASIEKLTSTVGFAPTIDFGTGIRMTIPWFESASASGQLSAWDS